MTKAEELKKAVEKFLEMPLDELKDFLPWVMDEIKKFGVRKFMRYYPDLPRELLRRVDEQAGKIARETPEVTRKFLEIMLESFKVAFERNVKVRKILKGSKEIRFNFEVTDVPAKGHIKIGAGKFSSGLTLLDNFDFKVTGPAIILASLARGDTEGVPAYMAGKYKIEGDLQSVFEVGMVMQKAWKILEES